MYGYIWKYMDKLTIETNNIVDNMAVEAKNLGEKQC